MDKIVSTEEIGINLSKILEDRFNFKMDLNNHEFLNKNLLGGECGLRPRHLVYLFFDIENKFNIKICDEDIINGKFSTFNNISNMILDKLITT